MPAYFQGLKPPAPSVKFLATVVQTPHRAIASEKAANGICAEDGERAILGGSKRAGAKAHPFFVAFAVRLKSCLGTSCLFRRDFSLPVKPCSFFAVFAARLNSSPDTQVASRVPCGSR